MREDGHVTWLFSLAWGLAGFMELAVMERALGLCNDKSQDQPALIAAYRKPDGGSVDDE